MKPPGPLPYGKITDYPDDHGHMVLFETQFRPNQLGGDDKGLSAPHIGICQFTLEMALSEPSARTSAPKFTTHWALAHGGEVVGKF